MEQHANHQHNGRNHRHVQGPLSKRVVVFAIATAQLCSAVWTLLSLRHCNWLAWRRVRYLTAQPGKQLKAMDGPLAFTQACQRIWDIWDCNCVRMRRPSSLPSTSTVSLITDSQDIALDAGTKSPVRIHCTEGAYTYWDLAPIAMNIIQYK